MSTQTIVSKIRWKSDYETIIFDAQERVDLITEAKLALHRITFQTGFSSGKTM